MAEYALILGGIAVVVIAAIVFLGDNDRGPVRGHRQLGHEPRLVAVPEEAVDALAAVGTTAAASGACRFRRSRADEPRSWDSARRRVLTVGTLAHVHLVPGLGRD